MEILINQCLNCNVSTSNPKFCCRSCSASYNNKLTPKRHLIKKCKHCNSTTIGTKYTYCNHCWKTAISPTKDMTLKEAIYINVHKASAFGIVRSRARSLAKLLGWVQCVRCGYDKHIEIAHIHPISEFPEHTLISVINDPSNLIALCPNCHWEFDHLQEGRTP